MQLDKQTLETLLKLVIHLEHNDDSLSSDDYWAITRLAQAVEAPQFITEHFARLANKLNTTKE